MANLHRRHLTPGQQAMIVSIAQDWSKAQAHGGDRRSDQAVTLPLDQTQDTVSSRQAQSGASDKTQRKRREVVQHCTTSTWQRSARPNRAPVCGPRRWPTPQPGDADPDMGGDVTAEFRSENAQPMPPNPDDVRNGAMR